MTPNDSFTEGKIYLGEDKFSDGETVGGSEFYIRDDNKKRHTYKYDNEYFDQLELVHAVGLLDTPNWEQGEVVILDEADEEFYSVAGYGFFRQAQFEILDKRTVQPGIFVQEQKNETWVQVHELTDDMKIITTDDMNIFRNLEDFKFAISDGCVASFQLVICIKPLKGELRKGNRYIILKETNEGYIIRNDNNDEKEYNLNYIEIDL